MNEVKELTELKNEFYEVMYKYEKSFSEEGVMANLTAWQTAKADLLSLLRRHPNWNEDEQATSIFPFSTPRSTMKWPELVKWPFSMIATTSLP